MKHSDESRQILKALPLISALSTELGERAISLLLENSECATIEADVEIFREGEVGPDLGIVLLSGSVVVEKSYGPPSTETAPALLGEIKQFDPKSERTATIRARERLEVLQFRWEELNAATEASLDESELRQFRKALLDSAWKHNLS